MSDTRRDLLRRAGGLALASATCGIAALQDMIPAVGETQIPDVGMQQIRPADEASAVNPSVEELMKPGPFPDKFLGSPQAPVTMIEYVSLTCTHCAQFAMTTFPQVKPRLIDTGKVRWTIRLLSDEPTVLATVAAGVARSADDYFQAVDILLQQQRNWMSDRIQPLMSIATKQLGFTAQRFRDCVANKQLFDDVWATNGRSRELGVTAIPTFFANGKKVMGFQSTAGMEDWLAPFLKT